MPPTGKSSDTLPLGLIIVIVIFFIAIISSGFYFYQSQEHQIKDDVTIDLSTIAALKVDQIVAWREERLFDARGISSEPFFIDGADHYLKYGDNESREKILGHFRELNASSNYQNIILVDPQGNVRLSLDPAITSIQPSVKGQVNASLKSGGGVLTDFYQVPGSHRTQLDAISPLLLKVNGSEKPVGVVVLSIDPDDFLNPLVQSWPVPSGSAETLLVEREEDHVLFLNELRHRNNTALNLTIPLSQTNVPAVMAVLGTTGAFIGKDYRGVDVISVLKPIPSSPWFIVAKVDSDEAFSGWRSSSTFIIALVAGLIIGALIIVGLLWQRWQKNYYRSLYTAEAARGRAEEAVLVSEIRYRRLFEAAQDGILILDVDTGQIVDVNPFLIDMLGFSREQFLAKKLWDIMLFSDIVTNKENFKKLQSLEYIRHEDLPLESADGRHIEVEFVSNIYTVDDKKVIQCNIRDITERKLAEEDRARLVAIVEHSDEAIISKTIDGIITSWNAGAEWMYGYSAQEMIGKSISLLVPPDHPDDTTLILERVKNGELVIRYETLRRKKDGGLINVTLTASQIRDTQNRLIGISIIGHDITERKKMESEIQSLNRDLEQRVIERTNQLNASLEDKIVLLQEVQHRVRNNFQVIISLLSLQSQYIEDEKTKQVFKESKNRIHAMALVHEKLHTSTDMAKIDLDDYFRLLGNNLLQFYGMKGRGVIINTQISDIHTNINTAIPIGLIVNELVSNSLKHAFPDGRRGEISIAMQRENAILTIVYKDNGIGIPANRDWRNIKSLGLQLVITLVGQLGGTIELDRTGGTTFTIVVNEMK